MTKTLDHFSFLKVTAAELKPLEDLLSSEVKENTRDIATCLFTSLLKSPGISRNLKPDEIAKIAIEQVGNICTMFGGHNLYVPKEIASQNEVRNASIKSEFNGKNISDLAKKYRLSEIQMRSILASRKPKR